MRVVAIVSIPSKQERVDQIADLEDCCHTMLHLLYRKFLVSDFLIIIYVTWLSLVYSLFLGSDLIRISDPLKSSTFEVCTTFTPSKIH